MLALAALGAAPATADTVVVPGAEAQRMTALDGALVWTTGKFPSQTLMQRSPDGTVGLVAGAPVAVYRSLDLGRDARNRLVLTYIRCAGIRSCKAISDDLAGNRVSFKRLAPAGCELTAAPSRWRERVAYGMYCTKRSGTSRVAAPARTGLFVRKGSAAPKRLRLPTAANKFRMDTVNWVDLRGTTVGAAVSDVYSYAFAQTVNGSKLRSTSVASSEGESDEHIVGQSLGAGGLLWTLVDAIHTGDPIEARISRLESGTCADTERLTSPHTEFERYPVEALAVDGSTVYTSVPGVGITVHSFTPTFLCR